MIGKMVLMIIEIVIGLPFWAIGFVGRMTYCKIVGGWKAYVKYDKWVTTR